MSFRELFVGSDAKTNLSSLLLVHGSAALIGAGAILPGGSAMAKARRRTNGTKEGQLWLWKMLASTRWLWWRGEQFASLLRFALVAPETPEPHCREVPCPVTISDNTNSTAATNGQSLHTHRRWFAAKNLSWRSRTRSWTPHGTPPKEASAHRVIHKKMRR
jgi:hypothetical protein